MTLLADKVSELLDIAISSTDNEPIIWRGIISDQDWKIQVVQLDEKYQFHIKLKRRDINDGGSL